MVEMLFDNKYLVDHLRDLHQHFACFKSAERAILGYVSTITEAELFAGNDVESKEKQTKLRFLIELFQKVDVNSIIARGAGEFVRKYKIEMPDAIIAATALTLKCKLLTRNLSDFNHIKEITVEDPY